MAVGRSASAPRLVVDECYLLVPGILCHHSMVREEAVAGGVRKTRAPRTVLRGWLGTSRTREMLALFSGSHGWGRGSANVDPSCDISSLVMSRRFYV